MLPGPGEIIKFLPVQTSIRLVLSQVYKSNSVTYHIRKILNAKTYIPFRYLGSRNVIQQKHNYLHSTVHPGLSDKPGLGEGQKFN